MCSKKSIGKLIRKDNYHSKVIWGCNDFVCEGRLQHLTHSLFFQRLRNRAMDMQYRKKYWQYWRGERPYPFANIPQPQGFDEPLRTYRNDYSDGNNG